MLSPWRCMHTNAKERKYTTNSMPFARFSINMDLLTKSIHGIWKWTSQCICSLCPHPLDFTQILEISYKPIVEFSGWEVLKQTPTSFPKCCFKLTCMIETYLNWGLHHEWSMHNMNIVEFGNYRMLNIVTMNMVVRPHLPSMAYSFNFVATTSS
jgi:hypothetical protein